MTTRRTFIQAAATAVPASLAAVRVDAALLTNPSDLHAVVIDEEHAAARAFGRRLAAYGAGVLSIREGDITSIWLTEVRETWKRRPAPIAGLTTPTALFCFEQLAFAHGLRVAFHAEHVVSAGGGVHHELQRTGPIIDLAAVDLARSGAHWPTRLADALSGRAKPRGSRPGPSLAALQPSIPEGATLLTSWIIAPV